MEINNNEDKEDEDKEDEDKEDCEDKEDEDKEDENKENCEDKTIICKNNIIDSNNNIDSNDLIKLCKTIESLENSHHIEIAKILKTNNVYLNENSNGIFVNLNKISAKVYKDICNYIDFIRKQESDINKDEKLKRNLQTTYFKDNKDITTTTISN
jgi:hypothetical protein